MGFTDWLKGLFSSPEQIVDDEVQEQIDQVTLDKIIKDLVTYRYRNNPLTPIERKIQIDIHKEIYKEDALIILDEERHIWNKYLENKI